VERRRQWAQEDLAHLDVSARFLREYIWRDGPRYWHDPEFDCTALWQDIEIDETLAHLFANILPSNDIEKGLHEIRCPIFLAAGESDYDCCPHILWPQIKNLPRRMEISFFKQSGHYPNYEESELFDQRVTEWVKANFSL
jgi:proline iminopeptidase